jgi:hypothetical protein
MHWNGAFAALPFVWHYEYTRNLTFAASVTYPLLDGLNAWSHCFLQRQQQPDGSYTLEDWNDATPDQEFENQPVHNPQAGCRLY